MDGGAILSPTPSAAAIPSNEEATAQLNALLAEIRAALSAALPELLEVVKEVGPLAQHAAKELDTLETRSSRLAADVQNLASSLRNPENEQYGRVKSKLAEVEQQLAELQDAKHALQQALFARDTLSQLANLLAAGDEDVAADALHASTKALETLRKDLQNIMPDQNEMDTICFPFEAEIAIMREELKRLLWAQLRDLICFRPRKVLFRSDGGSGAQMRAEKFWHGAGKAGLTDAVIMQLAESLVKYVLEPLVDACDRYSQQKDVSVVDVSIVDQVTLQSQARLDDSAPESETVRRFDIWEFKPVVIRMKKESPEELSSENASFELTGEPSSGERLTGDLKCAAILVGLVERLAQFITKRFCPGHPEALLTFGEAVYKEIAALLGNILIDCELDGRFVERLRRFEARLQALQFIRPDTATILNFCNSYDDLIFKKRQSELLAKVAELSSVPYSSTRRIGAKDSENIQFDAMMKAIRKLESAIPKLQDPGKKRQATALVSSLKESSLCLPECIVSTAAYTVLEMAEVLLRNVVTEVKKNATAKVESKLVLAAAETAQNMLTVFLTLRVAKFKKRMVEDAVCGAIFFNDCALLMQRLATISDIAARSQELCFLNMLLLVRTLQERSLSALMARQREQLLAELAPLKDMAHLGTDTAYTCAEATVGVAIQFIKSLAGALRAILPPDISAHCLGLIVNLLLHRFEEKVCTDVERALGAGSSTGGVRSDDMRTLYHLIASLLAQLTPLVTEYCSTTAGPPNPLLPLLGVSPESGCTVERWKAFRLFSELIDADETGLNSMRKDVSKTLSVRQMRIALTVNQWLITPIDALVERLSASND